MYCLFIHLTSNSSHLPLLHYSLGFRRIAIDAPIFSDLFIAKCYGKSSIIRPGDQDDFAVFVTFKHEAGTVAGVGSQLGGEIVGLV